MSNIVFGILVALKCCKPSPPSWGYDLEGQASTSRSTPGPLPGSARAEAERRRALALKALDIRLSTKHTPSPTGSPTPAYTSQTASPQTNTSQQNNPVLFDAGETMEANANVESDTVAIGIPHDDDKDSNW